MIVSSQFWPDIPMQEIEVPGSVQKSLETFSKGFEQLKVTLLQVRLSFKIGDDSI